MCSIASNSVSQVACTTSSTSAGDSLYERAIRRRPGSKRATSRRQAAASPQRAACTSVDSAAFGRHESSPCRTSAVQADPAVEDCRAMNVSSPEPSSRRGSSETLGVSMTALRASRRNRRAVTAASRIRGRDASR